MLKGDMGDSEHDAEIEGGIAFDHPTRRVLPLLVAPTLTSEVNAVREGLKPIACWSIGDIRFEFDSSFVKPEVVNETPLLTRSLRRHARGGTPPTLSIFGHADPVGQDEYNKQLSGRRAAAIYGLLTRDVALWERLYTQPFGSDIWGQRSVRTMLSALGYEGFSAAVDFQKDHGLVADGVVGPKTRVELFRTYMDALCVDDSGASFVVDKADFLASGADAGGKGDFQGCGELNPALLLSQNEVQTLPKPKRDAENTPNRRVVAFLFRTGTHRPPEDWPCPRATEGSTACGKRLFIDAERRRAVGAARREYRLARDTFACRFYDRLSVRSPCEGLRDVQLVEIVLDDPYLGFVGNVDVDLVYADGSKETLATTPKGALIVELSKGPFADITYERAGVTRAWRVFLQPADVSTDEGVWQRLVNLGYSSRRDPGESPNDANALSLAVEAFQADHRLAITGTIDADTRDRLVTAHDIDRRGWSERDWYDVPAPAPGDPEPKATET